MGRAWVDGRRFPFAGGPAMTHGGIGSSVLLLVLTLAGVARATTADRVHPCKVPGGVADVTSGRLFLSNSAGGIDAVDLGGSRLWTATAAYRPLLATGGRLLALGTGAGGKAQVVCLAESDGRILLNLDLPTPASSQPAVKSWGLEA